MEMRKVLGCCLSIHIHENLEMQKDQMPRLTQTNPGQPITAFLAPPLFLSLQPPICWRFVLQLFIVITIMLMCPLMKAWKSMVPAGG